MLHNLCEDNLGLILKIIANASSFLLHMHSRVGDGRCRAIGLLQTEYYTVVFLLEVNHFEVHCWPQKGVRQHEREQLY